MCMRVKCSKCGRPSWAGCGKHVEQVLAGVPAEERCRCREKRAAGGPKSTGAARPSWLDRLFPK